jgi:cytochrome oxidase assembly protein ShyY1
MPEAEWTVYHKFKPYFVFGQLDMSKEVLIPRTKDGVAGFDVINPLYCYEGGKMSMQAAFAKDDAIKIERAAIIVNRGWIPA